MITAKATEDILLTKVNLLSVEFDATKHRVWHEINEPPKDRSKIISVMSYNLLSQHYVWDEVFGCLDKACLNWQKHRFPLLTKTIKQFNSDIICLQELEESIYMNHWKENFPHNHYRSFYYKKSLPNYWGSKPRDFIDGVGIFINTDRFEIKRSKQVHFSNFIKENPSMFEIDSRTSERLSPRNNVALIIELYDKFNDKLIYVANTHLYWSPKFCDVKLIQIKLLLDILNEFIDKSQDPFIILCGDLNSKFNSSVHEYLNDHQIVLDHCKDFNNINITKFFNEKIINNNLKNPFDLDYAYLPLISSKKLTFTSYATDLKEILDHIWFLKGKFKILKLLGEVDQTYMENIIGFPTLEFPSDHIPLYVELAYN